MLPLVTRILVERFVNSHKVISAHRTGETGAVAQTFGYRVGQKTYKKLTKRSTIDSQIKFCGSVYCPAITLRGPWYLAFVGVKAEDSSGQSKSRILFIPITTMFTDI